MVNVTHCIYHGNCYDGFASALAIFQKWPHAKFIPGKYGMPLPELPADAEVVVCDFSFPKELTVELASKVKSVQVIDHHKTAEADMNSLPPMPNLNAIFDMKHSGAVLTWLWANPGEMIAPPFFQYIEDRDLWTYALPNSREVSACLQSYPYDFDVWNGFTKMGGMVDFQIAGANILRAKMQMVKQMADGARMIEIGGHVVPAANAACYFSEVGEELYLRNPGAKFAAYYMDRADGKRQWGLFSRNGDFDCSTVAKLYGGGGHKGAAGFTTNVPKEIA